MLAGYAAFLQLYATQPLLPMLTEVFHSGRVGVSLTLTAGSLGVALAAPFAGLLADHVGRRRVIIVSAFLAALLSLPAATVSTLPELIFWRFVQGVVTPGIFSVTLAYINDEWTPTTSGRGVSAYVSGTVLGGFSGRMISGWVAHYAGWQAVFLVLGALNLLCAIGVWRMMPVEKNFVRRTGRPSFLPAVVAHLKNRKLLATYAVGFCVLFSLVGTFTYITFHLAAPPFLLSPASLGSIFFAYVVGAIMTPLTGRSIDRIGHRSALACAILVSMSGVALTLIHNVWAVALGLAVCCTGVFTAQASASNYVGSAATENRALAAGLYAAFYHSGGSLGAALPGLFYSLGAWPACAAFIVFVQALTVFIAIVFWQPSPVSHDPIDQRISV